MAGGVIGNLRVNMGLDSGQFQAGLNQAQGSAEKFSKALKTTMVAAAAAVTAALGAIAVGVRSTLNSADELSKTASKIGIPIEELSKLKYAADMSGVSMQGLQTSVSRLSRNMSDAASGTGAGAKAFKALGINVKDADGKLKSSSAVMAEIADKLKGMPDGAKKTALAMEMMGKSGADMIPMLNGGSAALNELLSEAKDLGLEISESTGKAAEQFNDNISRMGYAVKGLTIGITAALAPALVVITDAMVQFVKWILKGVEYLPVLAEYVTVAGGALAVMFSPAILAMIVKMTAAIAVGMVGAVRMLTAAIAANPLGALAIGIAAAVTAIYHFRDEIKSAIGVDVVAIVKAVGNGIIAIFVGSFNAITATWSQLPAALGDLAYQAGYLLADNIRYWINEAILLVDGFIGTLNDKMGTAIGRLSTLAPVANNNPYKGAAAGVAEAVKTAMSEAFSTDYLGGFTKSIQGMNSALSDTSEILDDLGGDGGGGKGKSGGKLAAVKDGIKSAASEMERFVDAIAGTMASAFQGLIDGSKSVKETIQDLLKQLASMLMNQGFKALVGGLIGGGGGFGGLFGGLGKLFGFKDGGSFTVGGSGGTDSKVVAFRATPGEMVDVRKGNQAPRGGVQEVVVRGVFVDDGGVVKAQVTQMGQQAAQAGAVLATQQVKQSMPSLLANAQTRSM